MSDDRHNVLIPSAPQSTSALVQSALSEVQTEFALWSRDYSQQVLHTLSSTFRESSHLNFDAHRAGITPTDIIHAAGLGEQNWRGTRAGVITAMQTMYSPNGQVVSEVSVSLEVINAEPVLDTHPTYESCSPSLRNTFKGDDDDNMLFIPYADDPSFNQVDHSSWYESFSWQEDFDPDWTQCKSSFWRPRIDYVLDILWNMRTSKNAMCCR